MESVQANDEYAEIGFLNAVQLDPEEAEDPDRFEHEIIDFAYENGCTQQGDLDTMILLEINEEQFTADIEDLEGSVRDHFGA